MAETQDPRIAGKRSEACGDLKGFRNGGGLGNIPMMRRSEDASLAGANPALYSPVSLVPPHCAKDGDKGSMKELEEIFKRMPFDEFVSVAVLARAVSDVHKNACRKHR